jgi:tetratricopeptide (TPR) repeat protein
MRYLVFALFMCFGMAAFLPASAEKSDPEHQHHQQHELGHVKFSTSCSSEAESRMQTGVALLHHMMYDQAVPAFEAAARADDNCAIAHWGLAMTQLRPLWAPPTQAEFEKGHAAAQRALEIGAPTEREQAYIAAVAAYFDDDEALNHRARLAAWTRAQQAVHTAHPDDVDAGAFYALSQLATASPDDREFRQQAAAGRLLEQLHARAPEHPGIFHYLIHAYDNPALAGQATEVAHGYDELAPNVPHALHMPSHIFVRLGKWPEVIDWNTRSAEAALRQPVGGATSLHHVHALDYKLYAHLQQGEDKKARQVLEEINAVDNYQVHDAGAYGIAAAQARYPLERGEWEQAAALPLPTQTHSAFPWDDYPHHQSITWFARGLGAARSGDLDAAREAVSTLDELHQRAIDAGENYWAILVDARRKTVAAWTAFGDGNRDDALRLMREAADREDSVDKHPVTPSEVRPARELLGEMLVLLDRPEEAIEAYETALQVSPNRLNSLYGAGRAAEIAGREELARRYYEQVAELTTDDAEREALRHVRAFLAQR